MDSLLQMALEEDGECAKALPGEPVGVVVLVFAADASCAPVCACLPEHAEMVASCLPSAASLLAVQIAEQIVEQRRAEPLPHDGRADLIAAERIAARAIQKAKG